MQAASISSLSLVSDDDRNEVMTAGTVSGPIQHRPPLVVLLSTGVPAQLCGTTAVPPGGRRETSHPARSVWFPLQEADQHQAVTSGRQKWTSAAGR